MPHETEAGHELRRMVRNDPPWSQKERLWRLLGGLSSRLDFQASSLIGELSLGEVGLVAPNATTKVFEDSSTLIVFNSGLIEFVRAVIFTIMEGSTVYIKESVTATSVVGRQDAAMPATEVDAGLLELYRQWGIMWSEGRFKFPDIKVKPEAAKIGEKLFNLAMLFLLLHEYGHAVLHADVELNNRTQDHELEADRWSLEKIMRHFGVPRQEVQHTLLGAVMAIRTWAAIEAIGHKFPISYPPPLERFAAIMAAFRAMCDSEWAFYYCSDAAFSIDERMEAVEKIYKGLPHLPDVTIDRFISNVMTKLCETYDGSSTLDVLRRELEAWIPQDRLREMFEAAARIFTKDAPDYGETTTARGQQATYVVDTFGRLMEELCPVSGSTPKER